jgi:hypothetical protein
VVVAVGLTETEVPETVPTPLLMDRVGVGFPETDQDRVDDLPETIDVGEAVKETIVGATVAGVTVTVTWAVLFPAELVAVRV